MSQSTSNIKVAETSWNWILITAKVHENRPQITTGVTEQCDRVVENVDVD